MYFYPMGSFAEYCKKARIDTSEMKEVEGQYNEIKDWAMDPKGYFLIRVNKEENKVEVGYCPETNKITVKIEGKKPQDIFFKAIQLGLISRLDHAAYFGKELEKAFLALKYNLKYEQDSELIIPTIKTLGLK